VKNNEQREAAIMRMKALDDARVDMVKRHEKPAVIHAVSAAYLKEYTEVYGEDQAGRRRVCADPRPSY